MANLKHTTSSRQFEESGSQGTPGTNLWEFYFDSTGAHVKDDNGTVYDIQNSAMPTGETTLYVDAAALKPAVTNGPEASETEGTNNDIDWLAFDGTTDETAYLKVVMPPQYDGGTIQIEPIWQPGAGSPAASEYVRHKVAAAFSRNDDATDLAFGTAIEFEDQVIAAGDTHGGIISSAVTPAGTYADGCLLHVSYTRTNTGVTATAMGEDLLLLGLRLHYTNIALITEYPFFLGANDFTPDATGTKVHWTPTFDGNIHYGSVAAQSLATTTTFIGDVELEGTTIFSTRPEIATTGALYDEGVLTSDPTAFVAGDVVEMIVYQADSGGGCLGAHINLGIERTS